MQVSRRRLSYYFIKTEKKENNPCSPFYMAKLNEFLSDFKRVG